MVTLSSLTRVSWQGLTNPLPRCPGQAPNRAGQVLFPARRPAGQVKENFKQLKLGFTVSVHKRIATPIFAYVIIMIFSPLASQFAYCNPPVNPATFVYQL